jgi:phosphoenolpyruvate carboxylase
VRLRGRSDPALERRLAARLRRLPLEQLVSAARAFTVLSTLANVCESRHEVRTRRLAEAPFERLLRRLHRHGVTREAIERTAADLAVTVVFTHTRRRRRAGRCTACSSAWTRCSSACAGCRTTRARPRAGGRVITLWQASFLQHRAPTPIDEVVPAPTLETVLFAAVPGVRRFLRGGALVYGFEPLPKRALAARLVDRRRSRRNPHVTSFVTAESLRLYRRAVLGYRAAIPS